MQQFALDIGLESRPSFDNYVVGKNTEVVEHLRLWTTSATRSPVPTYLWGEAGVGKTHMLEACLAVLQQHGESVFHQRASVPQAYREDWSVAILDDVHRYNAEQQRVAFNVFVDAQKHQRWVLAAGDLPAVDLLHVREDLRSRLSWGHVFALQALSEADCRAVLHQEANERGILLSDEAMGYILRRCNRDMTSLMNLLNEMDGYAMQHKRGAITAQMVSKVLEARMQYSLLSDKKV